MDSSEITSKPSGRTALTIGFCAFLAIAGYFLWTEHRAHVMGALPWLLFLACPIIHLLMHRGHRGHGGHDHEGGGPR